MKDYKKLLAYQTMINANVIKYVEALQDKTLTKSMLHNRKAYAKRTKDLVSVLEYTLAFEINQGLNNA